MGIEFVTGFDHYNTAAACANEWDIASGSFAVPGRFSGYCVGPSTLVKYLPAGALQTRTIGFACKFDTFIYSNEFSVIQLLDNSTATSQVELVYSYLTHALTVTRNGTLIGTCSGTYLPANWYYFEFQVTISATVGRVQINAYPGGTIFLGTNLNTQASAHATADTLAMYGPTQWSLDDLYVTNGSTGFLGETRITTLLPIADGADIGFIPSSGTAHYTRVNGLDPETDTPSVHATIVGASDTYVFPASPFTGSIVAVQLSMSARKNDVGVRTLAPIFRTGGADTVGPAVNLLSNYKMLRSGWDTNPVTGTQWAAGDLSGAQFGMKVAS